MRSILSGGMPQPLSRTRTVALLAAVLDEELDAPALGDAAERVDRVVEDVGEHLAQLLARRRRWSARRCSCAPTRTFAASSLARICVSAESTTVARFTGAKRVVLLLGVLEEVRDAPLDAVELVERDLGVLDVLDRVRVLAHLLHQALGGGDRVADLVRDRRRELVDARLLLGRHHRLLAPHLALDGRLEVALPESRRPNTAM